MPRKRQEKRSSESEVDDDDSVYKKRPKRSSTTSSSATPKRKLEKLDSEEEQDTIFEEPDVNLDELFTNSIPETQQSISDIQQPTKSKESQAFKGLIMSIELVNFMCHKHLTVTFGPKVNFVIGQNGSGKSAILTGLSLCLGAKASFTQRASTAKSLIREGASTAQIIVKLRNSSLDPFRKDEYGDYIYVERKLKIDGAPTLYLRDENSTNIRNFIGKVVSTKKDDLIAIHEHFGLQMDNPMVILTQETAKRFLNTSKPSELFEFFMRGTLLEELSTSYKYILKKLEQMKASIQKAKEGLQEKKEEKNRINAKIRDIEKAKNMYVQLEDLQKEFIWCVVKEKEDAVEVKKKRIEEMELKIREIEQKIEDYTVIKISF